MMALQPFECRISRETSFLSQLTMSFPLLSILIFIIYFSCFVSATPFAGHSHSHHQHLHDHGRKLRAHGYGRRTFSIKQVPNPSFQPSTMSSGPAALLQAYLKHNIAIHPAVAKPSIGKLKGSVIANPNPSNYDREYLVPVTIGAVTPQTINLDLDTGSSDL